MDARLKAIKHIDETPSSKHNTENNNTLPTSTDHSIEKKKDINKEEKGDLWKSAPKTSIARQRHSKRTQTMNKHTIQTILTNKHQKLRKKQHKKQQ